MKNLTAWMLLHLVYATVTGNRVVRDDLAKLLDPQLFCRDERCHQHRRPHLFRHRQNFPNGYALFWALVADADKPTWNYDLRRMKSTPRDIAFEQRTATDLGLPWPPPR